MQALLFLLIVAIQPSAPIEGRYAEAIEVFHCAFDGSSDKNYDGWPDQWTRRRGQGFPLYVKAQISDEPSPAGPRCLRIDLDGAGAVAYSPPIRVGSLYGYVLEGLVQTEDLRAGRAWMSLTLLNEKRQRLETFASDKLQGSHGWKKLRLGPVSPSSEETRLAIIGLHLEPGPQLELKGVARFADIWLGRLPRLSLTATPEHHVFRHPDPVTVTCRASGFAEKDPPVVFRLEDALGTQLVQSQQRLTTRRATFISPRDSESHGEELSGLIGAAEWTPPIPGPGFYRVRVAMQGRKQSVHQSELTLAVIEPYASRPGNEFGWGLPRGDKPLPLALLAPLVAQAGVGRVKFPLWFSQHSTDADLEKLIEFIDRLTEQGIEIVGLLDQPPPELRGQFDDSGTPKAADVFTGSPKTWHPSLELVLTRLASQVRWWQLGDDKDASFVGYPHLAARIGQVKAQMDQTAHDVSLGIPWGWTSELPRAADGKAPWQFLSLSADPPLTERELAAYLSATRQAKLRRWVVLEPLARNHYATEIRIADLVRQMMACKVHDAEAVFLADPFSDDHGLMNDDGTPGELLLPWRTTALMLAGSRYLGTIEMPGASRNLLFSRDGEAILVAWNPRPTREVLYLGEQVRQKDLWGRTSTPEKAEHQHVLHVGPLPVFVTGVSEPVSRWRMEVSFERDRIPSISGIRHKNRLRLKNTFARGVSGTAQLGLPEGWTAEPREIKFRLAQGESLQQPVELALPYDACCGGHEVRIDFELQAERTYPFSVYRHIDVGLGDVYLEISTRLNPQGELEVDQRLINDTPHSVSFACELFAPDRQRQRTEIIAQGQGRDVKVQRLSNGKELLGKTLWLRAEEIGGPRVLNYRFTAER